VLHVAYSLLVILYTTVSSLADWGVCVLTMVLFSFFLMHVRVYCAFLW